MQKLTLLNRYNSEEDEEEIDDDEEDEDDEEGGEAGEEEDAEPGEFLPSTPFNAGHLRPLAHFRR